MPQSHKPMPATARRSQLSRVRSTRHSASTADGIAAERVALADRERGTTRARVAAHRLADIRVEPVQPDL